MTLRQLQEPALRYFLEVARCGSISAAAEHLHIAGSAISRQIARLEQTLGTKLFERHARGMVPTAEGEILAAHARRMMLDSEKAIEDILAVRGLRAGRVRIVASEAFANDFLPPLVAEFQRRHAGIVFEVNSAPPQTVSQLVRNGEADIGIKFSQEPDRDVDVQFRKSAPVVAVMRADHELASRDALELACLGPWPLALPAPETVLRQMFDIACSHRQLNVTPAFVSNNMVALHNFVLAGGGIAVSSPHSVRRLVEGRRVAAVPLRDPVLDLRQFEVQTLAGRSLPVAVGAFLELLKRNLED